jgi:DNA-binding NarL/FixJ family response regulator
VEVRRTRTFVADHHLLYRKGLIALLNAQPDFEVVGEAGDTEELDLCIETIQSDILVLDADLVRDNKRLAYREGFASTALLIVEGANAHSSLDQFMNLGARGYMLKDSDPATLLASLRQVAQSHFEGRLNENETVADLKALADTHARNKPNDLTLREQEVLKMLAEGRTVRETASDLLLSVKTVEAHKLNIMRKLDIHNRTSLTSYAVECGFVELLQLKS